MWMFFNLSRLDDNFSSPDFENTSFAKEPCSRATRSAHSLNLRVLGFGCKQIWPHHKTQHQNGRLIVTDVHQWLVSPLYSKYFKINHRTSTVHRETNQRPLGSWLSPGPFAFVICMSKGSGCGRLVLVHYFWGEETHLLVSGIKMYRAKHKIWDIEICGILRFVWLICHCQVMNVGIHCGTWLICMYRKGPLFLGHFATCVSAAHGKSVRLVRPILCCAHLLWSCGAQSVASVSTRYTGSGAESPAAALLLAKQSVPVAAADPGPC